MTANGFPGWVPVVLLCAGFGWSVLIMVTGRERWHQALVVTGFRLFGWVTLAAGILSTLAVLRQYVAPSEPSWIVLTTKGRLLLLGAALAITATGVVATTRRRGSLGRLLGGVRSKAASDGEGPRG